MNILYKGSARDEKTMDVNHDDGGFMEATEKGAYYFQNNRLLFSYS